MVDSGYVRFDVYQEEVDKLKTNCASMEAICEEMALERDEAVAEKASLEEKLRHADATISTLIKARDEAVTEKNEIRSVHNSLNSNLRKLGSGAPFLPAVELAMLQSEVVQLTREKKTLESSLKQLQAKS